MVWVPWMFRLAWRLSRGRLRIFRDAPDSVVRHHAAIARLARMRGEIADDLTQRVFNEAEAELRARRRWSW